MSVQVDAKFARFGSKSFAINKITSVDVRSETKKGGLGFIAFWAVALLGLPVAFGSEQPAIGLAVCALSAFLGWLSFTRSRDATTYRLYLVTSGNEVQAYETTDGNEVARLRTDIEDAMAAS